MNKTTSIINTSNIETSDILSKYESGKFRFISKCQAGLMSCNDVMYESTNKRYFENPSQMLSIYNKGTLQTIQFCPKDSNHWLTVFAQIGDDIKVIDDRIMENLEVGTINLL